MIKIIYICKKCGKEFISYRKKVYCYECNPLKKYSSQEEAIAARRKQQVNNTTKKRHELKEKAVKYKGGKCQICGYNKYIGALEFHHVDPNLKDFSISTDGFTYGWEKIKTEIDKCILVCSNCHKEIHAHIIEISDKELEQMINYKNENCCDIIHKKSIKQTKEDKMYQSYLQSGLNMTYEDYISSHAYSRKTKRPENYEQFIEEFNELGNNYSAMGRKYNVSDKTIKKWEKSFKTYNC